MAKKETVDPVLAFVESAKETDKGWHEWACYPYYEAESLRFEATDGKRLHYVVFNDAETAALHGFTTTGYYKQAGTIYVPDADVFTKYANIERIIQGSQYLSQSVRLLDNADIAAMRLCAETGITFQYKYVQPIIKLADKHVNGWIVHYTDKRSAVKFTAEMRGQNMKLYALVMPVWKEEWK